MTTVVGLAHPKTTIVVLAADRQATLTPVNGDAPTGKYLGMRKLWVSDDENVAFGGSGRFVDRTYELIERMKNGSIDFKKIVNKGKFPELRRHNIAQMGGGNPDLDSLATFLLATRFDDKPMLYMCLPLGNVIERRLAYIGSGSLRVQKYFNSLGVIEEARSYLEKNPDIENEDSIRVGLEATRYAQEGDIYSSGLDLVVLSEGSVNDHYTDLHDDFAKKLKRIQKPYKIDKKAKK